MKFLFLSTALLALATDSSWTHAKKDEMTANGNVRGSLKVDTKQRVLAGHVLAVDYTGSRVPIPDDGSAGVSVAAESTLDCQIADVDILVNIDHTYLGDLTIEIQSPSGTTVTLMSNSGGCDVLVNDLFTTFDDDAPNPSTNINGDGQAWSPTQSLGILNDESALGTWTLFARDNGEADTGGINAFKVGIVCNDSTDSPTDSPTTVREGCFACEPDVDGKVTICHRGEVPVTIEIGDRALYAHCENHLGDSCGACPE